MLGACCSPACCAEGEVVDPGQVVLSLIVT